MMWFAKAVGQHDCVIVCCYLIYQRKIKKKKQTYFLNLFDSPCPAYYAASVLYLYIQKKKGT